MKRFLMTLVLVSMILAGGAAAAQTEKAFASVVKVEVDRKFTSKVWSGVGFFVKKNYVVTCKHLFTHPGAQPKNPVTLRLGIKILTGKLVKLSKRFDLALIRVEEPQTPLKLCDNAVKGDLVYIYAFTAGDWFKTRIDGVVKIVSMGDATRNFGDLVTDMRAMKGNSGSPLIKRQKYGECVIGMTDSVLEESGLTWHVGTYSLRMFLGRYFEGR